MNETTYKPIRFWNKGDKYSGKEKDPISKKIINIERNRTSSLLVYSTINDCKEEKITEKITWLMDGFNDDTKNMINTLNCEKGLFIYTFVNDYPNGILLEKDTLKKVIELSDFIEYRSFNNLKMFEKIFRPTTAST